jgi:hypothetical protein
MSLRGFKILVLSLLAHQAIAATVNCPMVINTHQSLQQEINGWDSYTAATDAQHVLQGVTFYDKHPRQNASLAPDDENIQNNKLVWTFNKKSDVWLACRYANTNVQLIQRLPKELGNCTVTYDDNLSHIVKIDC